MVKGKGKGKALVSKSVQGKKNAANNSKANAAAAASEPDKMEAETPVVVSGGQEKKEDNKNGEVKIEENVENTPSKKAGRMRKRNRKKKMSVGDVAAEAAKNDDRPETSDRKKASKRAEGMGMIFMCSSKTKKDCYRYKVLGLPASKKETVAKIYKGMRLFLFDFDLRLMYGIYKAAGPGGYNIEPKAFKSAFPSQVRFTVLEDCLPLPEEKFRKVIKENYYGRNKFDCQLNSEQVKNLCKLFLHTTKDKSKGRGDQASRSETHTFTDRDRSRRQGRDRVRHPALVSDHRILNGPNVYEREFELPIRPPLLPPAETRAFTDRDRSRLQGRDRARHSALVGNHRIPNGPSMYEREAFESQIPPPPLPSLPLSYAYERAPLDTDYYRRESELERRDRLLDLERRRRDEIEYHDPYGAYREPPPPYREPPLYHAPLHDRLYPVGQASGYPPPPLYRL